MNNYDEVYDEAIENLEVIEKDMRLAKATIIGATFAFYEQMPTVSTDYLYTNVKFTLFLDILEKETDKLTILQQRKFESVLIKVYKAANPTGAPIPQHIVMQALSKDWAGRTFSTSIWQNNQLMKQQIKKAVVDSVAAGKPSDKAVSLIAERFGVAEHRVETLLRTETSHFINKGMADRYMEQGITQYKFIAVDDGVTSEECSHLNGEVFTFAEAVEGTNFPPIHPNCRSTIEPIEGQ